MPNNLKQNWPKEMKHAMTKLICDIIKLFIIVRLKLN